MMIRFVKMLAAAAVVTAAPALAVTYDAFASFTGVNGAGGFVYGYTDGAATTAFTTGGGCALLGASTCLHPGFANLPQASVGGTFPTVAVPTDALLLHPGDSNSLSVYASFVAPVSGLYTYTIALESVGIDTTDGTGYTPFTSIGGVVVATGPRGTLPTYTSTGVLTGTQLLVAGQSFGVFVDRNGGYGGDSTGLNFTLSAAPEPAAWALMIVGFGMVGAASRRRSASVAA